MSLVDKQSRAGCGGHMSSPTRARRLRELRKTVSVTGDEVLDHELGELEVAFLGAETNVGLRRQALGRLFAVIAACDLPPRMPT